MSGDLLRAGGGAARRTYQLLLTKARPHVGSRLPHVRYSRHTTTKFKAVAQPSPTPSVSCVPATASAALTTKTGFVSWYLSMIESRPVLTKSVTAGAIFTVADISSQMITSLGPLDWVRTLRMAAYGSLLSGPTLHLWFNFMSRVFPKQDVINTFKKMFCGQAFYGPIMTAIFFSVNAGLQGESSSEIVARLKRDLIPTLKNGLVYWPMCDFITFKFAPVRLQPLVSNSFSFLWTIYITYMASLKKASLAT